MILGGKGMQGLMNTAMKISKQKGDTSQPGHTHGGSESKNSQNSAARVAREASRPNGKQPQGAGSLFGSLIKTGGRPQQSNNFIPQTTQELGSELWQGQEMTAQKDAIASSRSEPSNLPKTGGRAEIYQDQTFSPFNQAGRKYNFVGVQGLEDKGKVKSDKKGNYVVNKEKLGDSRDTLRLPKNVWKNPKSGLIDDVEYRDIANKVNRKSPMNQKEKLQVPLPKPKLKQRKSVGKRIVKQKVFSEKLQVPRQKN